MKHAISTVRNIVFGAVIAGSLGFGATQATAAPSSGSACDGPGNVYLGTCPGTGPRSDCGLYCDSGVGVCSNGCCTCLI